MTHNDVNLDGSMGDQHCMRAIFRAKGTGLGSISAVELFDECIYLEMIHTHCQMISLRRKYQHFRACSLTETGALAFS